MIIIINFLPCRCRNLRNNFLRCATFRSRRGDCHLIKFYFPPTHFFREKLFLQKASILGNKYFAFGSVVEGVPNRFLWVSYEDAFFRFGFELFRLKFLDISIEPQTFRNDSFGFLPNQSSYGVISTDFDGALFKVNAAVSKANPQKDSGKSVRDIIDRTMSNKVRFRRSDTPL